MERTKRIVKRLPCGTLGIKSVKNAVKKKTVRRVSCIRYRYRI
jgi:hypothetical protein